MIGRQRRRFAASSPSAAPASTVVAIDLRRYERWVLEALEQSRRPDTRSSPSPTACSRRCRWPPTTPSPSRRRRCRRSTATSARWRCSTCSSRQSAERLQLKRRRALERVETAWADGDSLDVALTNVALRRGRTGSRRHTAGVVQFRHDGREAVPVVPPGLPAERGWAAPRSSAPNAAASGSGSPASGGGSWP